MDSGDTIRAPLTSSLHSGLEVPIPTLPLALSLIISVPKLPDVVVLPNLKSDSVPLSESTQIQDALLYEPKRVEEDPSPRAYISPSTSSS